MAIILTRNTCLAEPREAREGVHRGLQLWSSLKQKTLVKGPFDGSRNVHRRPSLFTMLL